MISPTHYVRSMPRFLAVTHLDLQWFTGAFD